MIAEKVKLITEQTIFETEALRELALELSREFKADNPRFDKEKFLKACGFGG